MGFDIDDEIGEGPYVPLTIMAPRVKCRFCGDWHQGYLQFSAYRQHLLKYHRDWPLQYHPGQVPPVRSYNHATDIAREDFAAEMNRREAERHARATYRGLAGETFTHPNTFTIHERENTNMDITQIENRIEYHQQQLMTLDERLAFLETLPQDDEFEDGSVITFKKKFHDGPGAREYTYAAVKYDGVWSTTGPRSPKGIRWEQLLDFITSGVEEVWFATEWERII